MLIYKITNSSRKEKYYISRSIKKHGKENFKIEQIDFAESETELKSKESYWIAKYQSNNRDIGYNNTLGGELSMPNDVVIINMVNSRSTNSNILHPVNSISDIVFGFKSWYFHFLFKIFSAFRAISRFLIFILKFDIWIRDCSSRIKNSASFIC